ncbi:hypothetical protein [Streptomyces sp. NBC_00872]|uniref:hypothetical protein n=1 Tax=Streptomyces sp. NBC_00872 TaxID=2903686 RepID=UPI00386B85C1|nr:hypothetical protein OG214_37585 [Streptomyces sp. NBC_00872]
MLKAQRQLLDLISPDRSAEESSSRFTDLRVLTSFLSTTWSASRDMIAPSVHDAVAEHVLDLDEEEALDTRQVIEGPDCGGLAADRRLRPARRPRPRRRTGLARERSGNGSPSRTPWTQVLDRHRSSCSERMREPAAPSTRSYRRVSPRGLRISDRIDGYRPEHVVAFLEQDWFEKHLAPLGLGLYVKPMCRSGPSSSSSGEVAEPWVTRPTSSASTPKAANTARQPGSTGGSTTTGRRTFTRALRNLARDLDTAAAPINYRRRREALHRWALTPDTWQEITDRLPHVPGHIQPNVDDRKRQEASAFIWTQVTHGEPLFEPRTIEEEQHETLRRTWLDQRSSTWAKLARPGRIHHFTALRGLLLQHGDTLIKKIDSSTSRSSD